MHLPRSIAVLVDGRLREDRDLVHPSVGRVIVIVLAVCLDRVRVPALMTPDAEREIFSRGSLLIYGRGFSLEVVGRVLL